MWTGGIDNRVPEIRVYYMDELNRPDHPMPVEARDRIRRLLPGSGRVASDLADFFKLFSDPTRIRILFALGASELCVGDIAELLEMNHSAVSPQLRLLSRSRRIRSRKTGKNGFYSLNDRHIKNVLSQGFEHIRE